MLDRHEPADTVALMADVGRKAREAARPLSIASDERKHAALIAMADAILRNQENILQANALDLANGEEAGLSPAMMDRLPSIAPRSPPDTGASSMSIRRAASICAISRAVDGGMVLWSMNTQPGDALAAGKPTRYADLMTPEGLQDIASYADIIGPWTRLLIPATEGGTLGTPTPLMADARRAGLQVWPYTFRPENHFLPAALQEGGDPRTRNEAGAFVEIRAHIALEIGGFFTDDPALGRRAVDER